MSMCNTFSSSTGSLGVSPYFPNLELDRLNEMVIWKDDWCVPVLPNGELEILLTAALNLAKQGLDEQTESCYQFYQNGLTASFTKLLTYESLRDWEVVVQDGIRKNCELLVELCAIKLKSDSLPLLRLLLLLFNPQNLFHEFHASEISQVDLHNFTPGAVYAISIDSDWPKGWLVDLLNRFGNIGGFNKLCERFQSKIHLSLEIALALLKPFSLCYTFLTTHTIETYFQPIAEIIPSFFEQLLNDELQEGVENNKLEELYETLQTLFNKLTNKETAFDNLHIAQLKAMLQLLKVSEPNKCENVLNRVNRITSKALPNLLKQREKYNIEVYIKRVESCIKENLCFQSLLKDDLLCKPSFTEELTELILFAAKQSCFTSNDTEYIWNAQINKSELIVENMHKVFAKLIPQLLAEDADTLFQLFQNSWVNLSNEQKEKVIHLLLEVGLYEKGDPQLSNKVLNLLWNIGHSDDSSYIIGKLLAAHIKILEHNYPHDHSERLRWLNMCIEDLRNEKWVLPALKQIMEICFLYPKSRQNCSSEESYSTFRHEVIKELPYHHSLIKIVVESLTSYMDKAHDSSFMNNAHFNHTCEIQERLNFVHFMLQDGQQWLCFSPAQQIWTTLTENSLHEEDRDICFKYFSKLASEDSDMDPKSKKQFFESVILKLEPSLLTVNGMICFDSFFKEVNWKEKKLVLKYGGKYMMNDVDLIGLDYLFKVIMQSKSDTALYATELLHDIYTTPVPQLSATENIHSYFINMCTKYLKTMCDPMTVSNWDMDTRFNLLEGAIKANKLLKLLIDFASRHGEDNCKTCITMPEKHFDNKKHLNLWIRLYNENQQADDFYIEMQMSDTLGFLRHKINANKNLDENNVIVDLFINGEILDSSNDDKPISKFPFFDNMLILAKLRRCKLSIALNIEEEIKQLSSLEESENGNESDYDCSKKSESNLLKNEVNKLWEEIFVVKADSLRKEKEIWMLKKELRELKMVIKQ